MSGMTSFSFQAVDDVVKYLSELYKGIYQISVEQAVRAWKPRMCTGKYAFNIFDCRKKETGGLWRKRNICGV